MLIDDISIHIKAGKGGAGGVGFDKTKMGQGPTGSRGGNGGSIFFEGISDLNALSKIHSHQIFKAQNGELGNANLRDGANGEDIIIKIPVGTIIHNLTNNTKQEIISVGEKIMGAKGGFGGKGNFHFRSSRNTSPKQSQPGLPGEEFDIRLELKLIADIGLIGLPNVGKSSLINELTRSKSKVANYSFTTLEPHLGAYYELIIADIPGLIKGASSGKGLGIKFLKHIERTKILFHLISAESNTPVSDYKSIRQELKTYNKELLSKKEYLFLSKSDTENPKNIAKKIAKLKKLNPNVSAISIFDFDSIKSIKKLLSKLSNQKTK